MYEDNYFPKELLNVKIILSRECLNDEDNKIIDKVEEELKELELPIEINGERFLIKAKNVKLILEYYPVIVNGININTEEEIIDYPKDKIDNKLCHEFISMKATEKFNEFRFNEKKCNVILYE